ncbi:hypothetical protein E2C01_091840 [Portunus trituberculatus]|uniref:Uncharacterized protein n=1 Tax=Portunus trituberculatus TaxID=210409 RepID=A0A5B7JW59_PORTR|nr:hypothetical protein [Portunus trituberculatus]
MVVMVVNPVMVEVVIAVKGEDDGGGRPGREGRKVEGRSREKRGIGMVGKKKKKKNKNKKNKKKKNKNKNKNKKNKKKKKKK